jgi:hypothetical protein
MADKVNKQAAEREKLIERNMARLYAKKASDRREAAYWLGEAVADEAVDDLVRVYHTDRDAGVRAAAAYALGQFRAIEQALARGDDKHVADLLAKVEAGKYGSRGGRGRWWRIMLGLLLSFGVFAALALFFYGGAGGIQAALQAALRVTTTPTPAPDVNEIAVYASAMRSALVPVSADINTLQQQFTTALAGDTPDCGAAFNRVAAFALPADAAAQYPELDALAMRINEMQASFDQAYTAFNDACQSGAPVNAASVGPAYAALRPAITAAPQVDAALNALVVLLTPTPTGLPTNTATRPPSATPTPVITAVPTTRVQLTDPRQHINALYGLIEQMNGTNGQALLLREYWGQALRNSSPVACSARAPEAPAAYVLPEADASASPALAEAVALINSGLENVRLGFANFFFTCASGTVQQSAIQGQLDVQTAIDGFERARTLLDTVAGS